MKKNYLCLTMALFTMCFTSCSQEEVISDNEGGGNVVISVNIPGADILTRSMPEVTGMERRCIMQVVDERGTAMEGENMKQTKKVEGETVVFSFTEPAEAYKVVFWADYVKTGGQTDNVYNTESLPTISYKDANGAFTAAGDAFCGTIDKGATSVTLKRPFSKVVIGSTLEAFKDYTEVAIGEFAVPDSYDILGKTTSKTQNILLTKKTMDDANSGVWASFFRFAPSNEESATISLPITVYKGQEEKTFTATATAALDANLQGYIDIKEEPEPGNSVNVEISFDDQFYDPDKEVVEVGNYINAAGKVVTSKEDAVAVVFAMASADKVDNSDYGEGKKPQAYAIALEVKTGRSGLDIKLSDYEITTATEDNYSGYKFEGMLRSKLTTVVTSEYISKFWYRYFNAKLPELTGSNLSSWYLPSAAQLLDATAYLNTNTDLLNEKFAEKHTTDYFIATSSVASCTKGDETYMSIQGVMYSKKDSKFNDKADALNIGVSAFGYPVVTIFE